MRIWSPESYICACLLSLGGDDETFITSGSISVACYSSIVVYQFSLVKPRRLLKSDCLKLERHLKISGTVTVHTSHHQIPLTC